MRIEFKFVDKENVHVCVFVSVIRELVEICVLVPRKEGVASMESYDHGAWIAIWRKSDSVKRHLSRRHLSVLDLKFDFISDGGCTREEQIAFSLKRHLFPHGGREPKAFWICFPTLPPILNIFFNFLSSALKLHVLKRHLTLSEKSLAKSEIPKRGRTQNNTNEHKSVQTQVHKL